MRRFFAGKVVENKAFLLDGEAEHFSRVLRMAVGDSFLAAYQGRELVCRALSVEKGEVCAEILESRDCPGEPSMELTLYVAYMKSDKMELILQKTVELGICCFAPFVSSRCVKKPKEGGKAQERFEKIAEGAVKQCGRAAEVRILQPLSFKEVLEKIPRHDAVLFAYEKSEIALRQVFEQVREQRDIALIVGPEGGFSEREAEQIIAAGGRSVSLGRRILRGETAAIALTALAAYETGC
ncbi:MAG: 16S rRNA (uracil(1498)-N(3))-methyltransferase [Clostridiales bacterium]|nr:16S rRNA (uracil(1498)-N(3))-methyltransferase [Clostridiales bacterium]